MDANRFDALTRLLRSSGSRRTLTRGGAGLGALLAGASAAVAGRCGPCERKTKRGCKPRKDNTTCRTNGCCRDGRCFAQPTCLQFGESCAGNESGCCAGPDGCLTSHGAGQECGKGGRGRPCVGDDDCVAGRTCVGYRCG